MNKNNSSTIIGILIICIIGIGVLDVVSSRLAKESTRIAGEVQSDEQRDEHYTRLTNDWEKIASQVQAVQSLLPDETSFPLFVDFLESSAKSADVTLQPDFDNSSTHALPKSTALQKSKSDDAAQTQPKTSSSTDVPTITFVLDVTGPVSGIETFYNVLESSPYFLRIDSAILKTADGLDKPAMLTTTLTLYVDTSLKQ